jgi:hypothetical protein
MRNQRLAQVLGTMAAVLLTVAGCSQTTAGTATPSAEAPSGGQAGPDQRIADPLDPSAYEAKPCDALPSDALNQWGYTGAGAPDLDSAATKLGGPGCTWTQSGNGRQITFGVGIKGINPGYPGVTSAFEKQRRGLLAYADPIDVDGYPSVYTDVIDGRANGSCGVLTAVADDQTISSLTVGYHGEQDSCDLAKQLISAAIKKIKGGA